MTHPAGSPTESEHLVAIYHRYGREGEDTDFWAYDRVGEIVQGSDSARAWELVLALVRTADDDRLDYVGAGPVEDLVNRHGSTLVDSIVAEARRDSRFRQALASIWLVQEDVQPEVLRRLRDATHGKILVATQAEIDAANPKVDRKPLDRDA